METVFRGAAIYLALLVITRFSGRRTLGQLTVFEFVLLLIIAETTQQALLGEDFSITNALLLIVTLFALDLALSYVKQWSRSFAIWVEGQPTVLISLGVPDERALARSRVSLEGCSNPPACSRASSGWTRSSSRCWSRAVTSASSRRPRRPAEPSGRVRRGHLRRRSAARVGVSGRRSRG
jgi:hypothetical protein